MPEPEGGARKEIGDVLLDVRELKKHFPIEKGFFRTCRAR